MSYVLPELPYAKHALEPHLSAETLDFHYGKHHQTYVTNLNNLVPAPSMRAATGRDHHASTSGGIFNNAHKSGTIRSLAKPVAHWRKPPTGPLASAIEHTFGPSKTSRRNSPSAP